jgi:hypothetical protein
MSQEYKPPAGGQKCPPGYVWENTSGKCLPEAEKKQEAPAEAEGKCSPDTKWNIATKKCEPIQKQAEPPPAAPKAQECPKDQKWDEATKKCVPAQLSVPEDRLGKLEAILSDLVNREQSKLQAEEKKLSEGIPAEIMKAVSLIPNADARLEAIKVIKAKFSAPDVPETTEHEIRAKYSQADRDTVEKDYFGITLKDYVKQEFNIDLPKED